jgi:adenylyltransferase/sulfurtransferase
MTPNSRYARLARFSGFAATLPRWQQACCAVVGLGGLGGGLALQLARLGVARLVLIDRDIVSAENLGHQALFTEAHAAEGLPKAQAAADALAQVNSAVELAPHCASLTRHNIAQLLARAELIFDGLDNYYTRFLLNDYALARQLPYLYAGVVRGELAARAIVPAVTGCLRCLLPEPPPAGSVPTCAAEGVFPPLLGVANALQLDSANRILAGGFTAADDILYTLTTADWQLRHLQLRGPRAECPACSGEYAYLSGLRDAQAQAGCTPDEVELQLAPLDLDGVQRRLAAAGGYTLRANRYCLSAEAPGRRYTIFASGRVVLAGTADASALDRFVAEYLGI